MKQILLTLVFSVVNTWSAWALDFGFRHLNTSNGLPNQQVEAIVQDADGYIWIGTRNGLAKFDGYKSGHALNNQLLRNVQSDPSSYEIVTFDDINSCPITFVHVT